LLNDYAGWLILFKSTKTASSLLQKNVIWMIAGGNIQKVFGVTKFCLNILAYLPSDSNGLMECHISLRAFSANVCGLF
jgi:hypothetical protein